MMGCLGSVVAMQTPQVAILPFCVKEDMDKDPSRVFYLPIHAVYKSSSTTMKI